MFVFMWRPEAVSILHVLEHSLTLDFANSHILARHLAVGIHLPYTGNIGRSLNSSGTYRRVMELISWPPACMERALLPLSHHPAQHFFLKSKMNKVIFLNNKIFEIRNSILFTVQYKTSSHCL